MPIGAPAVDFAIQEETSNEEKIIAHAEAFIRQRCLPLLPTNIPAPIIHIVKSETDTDSIGMVTHGGSVNVLLHDQHVFGAGWCIHHARRGCIHILCMQHSLTHRPHPLQASCGAGCKCGCPGATQQDQAASILPRVCCQLWYGDFGVGFFHVLEVYFTYVYLKHVGVFPHECGGSWLIISHPHSCTSLLQAAAARPLRQCLVVAPHFAYKACCLQMERTRKKMATVVINFAFLW